MILNKPKADKADNVPKSKEAPAEPKKDRTRTEIKRDTRDKTSAPKGAAKKASVKRTPVKSEEKKASSKTSGKKTAKKVTKPARPATKKTAEKKPAAKKTVKADVKKISDKSKKGVFPPELKGFEKRLKDYAVRARITYGKTTANRIFTEYMSRVFRDMGHNMVIIRDPEEGVMTMMERTDWTENYTVKNKIVVRCVFVRGESIGADQVKKAQEDGLFYHSDETWCVTPTDFTRSAVTASRKEEINVRLIDGKKLYSEYISEFDKRDE